MGAPVVHFEIGCRDAAKNSRFYTELFGWTTEAYGPACMINTQNKSGIAGHLNQLGHEPHNYVTIYAQVDDLQKSLDLATKLGGRMIVPPTEVPQMGSFAWLADPEGNAIGLWKPMMPK
jgi:uncharacterized protein